MGLVGLEPLSDIYLYLYIKINKDDLNRCMVRIEQDVNSNDISLNRIEQGVNRIDQDLNSNEKGVDCINQGMNRW